MREVYRLDARVILTVRKQSSSSARENRRNFVYELAFCTPHRSNKTKGRLAKVNG